MWPAHMLKMLTAMLNWKTTTASACIVWSLVALCNIFVSSTMLYMYVACAHAENVASDVKLEKNNSQCMHCLDFGDDFVIYSLVQQC